jgi:hypothetical protein
MSAEQRTVNVPPAGGLIYFPPTDFSDTRMTSVYFLSNAAAPPISGDRDRAVLRAYLTLALARLDAEEAGP